MFPVSMFRSVGFRAIAGAVIAAICTGSAQAQSFSDIQYWVGSGSNQAAFIVDWNDGKDAQSLMWGFRWDGTATGEDMLHAIVTADTRLFAHVSTPFGGGLGTALYGMGYDLDNDANFGVSPSLTFDAGGYSVGGSFDGRTPTDASDHWQEGWMSDGYWSYWLGGSGASPVWGFSGVGMSTRTLVNGSWDGWSYAPGFNGEEPSLPVPATVPTPGALTLLGMGGLFAMRRRVRGCVKPIAAVAGIACASATASAQYQYNPNDFAVEVVSSTGLAATSLYNDPAAVLGRPTLKFNNGSIANPDFRRTKIIEPAYSTGLANERLITTFNAGQSVTVRMGRTVYDDPNNPYGIDLNVFGNAFFAVSSGGFVSDATNLNTANIGGGIFAENVRVSVSPDNINWYSYTKTGDGFYPTNSYRWDAVAAAWTNDELDPTKPVNPALTAASFAGTAANALALYNGSAGGAGFDLGESGFSFINYVRFDGLSGFSGGEIDAVAAVNAIPSPGAISLLGVCLLANRRRRH
jgi:MYXO-CTERM domain-containing protein